MLRRPSVGSVPPALSAARLLQDREIMLRCLAEAAAGSTSDLAAGPARRMLEVRLRSAGARSAALNQRAEARTLRDAAPQLSAERRAALQHDLSMGLLQLDLRRGDLWAQRFVAGELRAEAQALRAQARQVRRHRRLTP